MRTRKVGHFFPGGTVDAFDVWVELEAVDDKGRTLLHSGDVADGGKGPVEPGAHFYRSLLLDEHGNPINKRNAWATRSVAYVRLIPPGAADTVHYRLDVPEDAGGQDHGQGEAELPQVRLVEHAVGVRRREGSGARARSRWRPGHDDGRWVFDGDTSTVSGRIKAIPDIPTTVMAEAQATLVVVAARRRAAGAPAGRPAGRCASAGTTTASACCCRATSATPRRTFLKVTEMDPGYADGWVNVARARIQEGDTAGAEGVLRKALALEPGLAKTHFFLAVALKARGEYDEALRAPSTRGGAVSRATGWC